jgi:MFS family permease
LNKEQLTSSDVAGFSLNRMSKSLQSPVYRIYYLAVLGQSAGMVVGQVAGPLLIFRLTGSSVLLGAMSLTVSVPLIVMSLLGGVIADRVSKKQIVFACLMGFAAVSLIIALCLDTGLLSRERSGSWWIMLVSSFIQGCLMGMMMPAFQSIIPEIIDKKLVMNAATLNTLGMNVLGLVVPVVTGVVIDHLDFEWAYYFAAGLYALGAVFLLFLPKTGRMGASGGKMASEIKNGFTYIGQSPLVLMLLLFTLAMVVLSMPYQQLLPLFTDNILHVGATGLGLLMSVCGAGALAGSLILAVLPNTRRGLLLLLSGLSVGVALLVFAFSAIWGLSIAMMVFVGLGQTFRNTISNALLLTHTTAAYLGRVMALLNVQWGVMAFGTFFAGVLADIVSVQWVIGSLSILLVLVTALFLVFNRGIRRLA